MPYILDACRHPIYGIRCIYTLFNPIAAVLGPEETRRQLLPLLQSALNPEKTTVHHWRCFTRRFVIQLIARFSLSKFLQSFPILLIEACSGFKDDIVSRADVDDEQSHAGESTADIDESNTTRSNTMVLPDSDSRLSEVRIDMRLAGRSIEGSLLH